MTRRTPGLTPPAMPQDLSQGMPHRPLRARRRPAALAAAAVLVAALGLVGCGDPDPAELLGTAKAFIAKKDLNAARLPLKTLLQTTPDNAEARFLLGQVAHDLGDMAGAEAELRRAAELGHAENAVLPLLASALVGQGKGSLALQQYRSVRLTDAGAQAALDTHLATAEAAGGDIPAAIARVGAVLAAQPGNVPALQLRAQLAAAQGDVTGALAQAQALIAQNADNGEAWQLKADLLLRGGKDNQPPPDKAQAVEAYRQALKRKPDNVAVHAAVLMVLLGQGDNAGATAQLADLQKVAPKHPQTLFFEAVLAEQKGDFKRTRELTQLLLRNQPDNVRVLVLAGQAELKLNALSQAEAYFAKAIQLNPRLPIARRQMAQVLLRTGQADKAVATLAPLVGDTSTDLEAITLTGQAQLMKGDGAGADASFARAAKIKPDDLRVRTAAALSGLSRGRGDAALAELRAIAAADKGNTADMALINALVAKNQLDAAAKAVDKLAEKQPTEPLPDHLHGRIALQRQDTAAARQHFEAALAKNADYMPAMAGLAALDINDKQFSAAKARFEAALQRNPKNTAAMIALAEVVGRGGAKTDEVVDWLNQAVAADPTDVVPRLMLIDQLLAGQRLKPALDAAQAGLAAVPDNAELLDRLGRAQLATGDAQQAVTTFNKLVSVAPRAALPQLRLADAQAAARNPGATAAAVRRAADLAPDSPMVQAALVKLAISERRFDQGLVTARKVQAQRPDSAEGFSMEGDIELQRRNWDAAAAALRKAMGKRQPGDAAQRLHAALWAGKRTAEAEQLAAEWRKAHPDDAGFALHLGDLALAGGNPAQAETLYREVVDKQPGNVVALNNLAYVTVLQKKPGAVALAEKALAQAPASASVMDTLALALAADNQLPRAVEVQAQAVKTSPDVPQFRLQLAKLHLQAGDKSAARGELTTLAALGSSFARQAEVADLIKAADK